MECLNKSVHAFYKVVEFNKPNLTRNNKIHQEKVSDDYQILTLEQTIEILQEQIKTLEQELHYEQQLVEEYNRELRSTHSVVNVLNCELQNLYRLERLNLDKVK